MKNYIDIDQFITYLQNVAMKIKERPLPKIDTFPESLTAGSSKEVIKAHITQLISDHSERAYTEGQLAFIDALIDEIEARQAKTRE